MTDVLYESSDETVAEVDAQTGEITFKGVVGDVTITATASATSLYKAATASYTISLQEMIEGVSQYKLSYSDVAKTTNSYTTEESSTTAADGSSWTMKGYIKSESKDYIQLGKGGANYIITPSSPNAIKKITVICGSSYNLTVCSLDGTELFSTKPGGGSSDYAKEVVFDLSGSSYSQVKLIGRRDSGTSNAAVYISSINVEY